MAITPPHCAALWHWEGRGGEGAEEGEGGGRKEGVKAVRPDDRGWGELLLLGLP